MADAHDEKQLELFEDVHPLTPDERAFRATVAELQALMGSDRIPPMPADVVAFIARHAESTDLPNARGAARFLGHSLARQLSLRVCLYATLTGRAMTVALAQEVLFTLPRGDVH